MVDEDAALLDRPVTPVTPTHFSSAVYKVPVFECLVVEGRTPEQNSYGYLTIRADR
jgi:hypothetical protein